MISRRSLVSALAGGSLALTIVTQAQDKVWRVGFLSPLSTASSSQNIDAFVRGMRELGYVDGKNVVIEWRFADGKFQRLPSLAAELVQLKVDVIVAAASPAIGAAQRATTTIPIIMATTGDPVGSGFVKSLARPGGNITGLSSMSGDIGAKLFDLLHSAVPSLSSVAVLVTPTSTTYREILEGVRVAAQASGVRILAVEASSPQEIDSAFSLMARDHADAVIVGASSFFSQQRQQLAELATRYRIPSMFGDPAIVESGGLMSYGYKVTDNYERAATYVDKVLRGAKPGDLPVEQPATLHLVVNLKTAKAIGLTLTKSLLLLADEVIE